ncbi:dynein light chain roadblock-type 1-like [Sipha flava]|uniref:Dynein light chain roadblock-type 1-like n=1 Tax=Sipha flava TaxID=143950 RepID=A0A8B8FVB8_9HEMI|nr:dynein light chain roadblock-type 1-like [Sipha flava]XP_025414762.1 dynein light chain roadblock-type 1-like [Sipha flava]XP_025414763.1 dynein light chain roadblock-type 1-like [Sipha flava]
MTTQVDEAFKKIQSSDRVEGFIILDIDGVPIKSTIGNSATVQYSSLVQMIIGISKHMFKKFDASDVLMSMRLHTKKNEIIIILDKLYTMIVIQSPSGVKPPM